ncbi:MAG: amidohydrolase family protein [Dehalococcoidales bacterium]|nr:amidohydrolase family protein [Dehalococcoidales bacterium]
MLALTNLRLIDGTGHDPIDKMTIIIDGKRIESVGPGNTNPGKTQVIDLMGCIVMPGLIDCHLHLGGLTVDQPGKAIGKVSFMDMASFSLDYIRNYAHRRRLAIENGVTTIRSAGDLYPHILRLRDKIAAGKLPGPRIFAPGPTITAPGGHPAGTIYKGNRYIIENAVRQIADVNSGREEVRRLFEGGVDCIKAIYSDIDPMDITHTVPRLSLNVLETLADEAHQHNLRLMVHTGSMKETMDAVKAGADSIEHGILPGAHPSEFNEDVIKIMLDKGTCFVPTLAIAWAYKDTYPDVFSGLKKTFKKLHGAGVNIAAGTDSGTPGVVIGKGLHKELELMVEAGISPLEAITAGTKNAADNLGKASELGTIEPGKIADLIAVSGDPVKNIRNTREIRLVIKDGVILVNRISA